jgi:small subunit ribosomal protein S16
MKPRERRDQTKKNQPRTKAQERLKAAASADAAPAAEGEKTEAAAS